MNINRPSSFNPLQGAAKPTSSANTNHSFAFSDSVQTVLSELGIPNSAITSVKSHQGTGAPLIRQGLDVLSQIQVNADISHLLNQMGLVSSQISLAIAIQGSDTVRKLRKRFLELEDELSESEQFAELCQALGIEEPSDGLLLIKTTGGLSFIASGLESFVAS